MKRFFRNLNWKNILIISLVLVLGIGAIAGVSSIVKDEKTTINATAFKRGALNDLGFYIESDQSIYTKDLIECQGLEIEPDFEVIGNYRVYYYDANKIFIGTTDLLSAQEDGVYVKGEEFPFAKYCRIVITPTPETDEDGHVDEDFKINFYEVYSYANKYRISVKKEQKKVDVQNLFDVSTIETNCMYSVDEYNQFVRTQTAGVNAVTLNVTKNPCKSLRIDYEIAPGNCTYIFFSKSSTCVETGHFNGDETSYVLEVPSDAVLLVINYDNSAVPSIYRAS